MTQFPIDYNAVRKAFANIITKVTGLVCVLEEPTYQNAPRPALPYFSFKIITPGARYADDATFYSGGGEIQNHSGPRKMTVSFHCYAQDQETAYNFMALWQASLDTFDTQELLLNANISVWLIGTVADLSQLLNTGYEGRSHMDTDFGIGSFITEDQGEIDTAHISGTIDTNNGIVNDEFTAP